MSWIDKLKKIFKEQENAQIKKVLETISIEQLPEILNKKLDEYSKENKNRHEDITERINKFNSDIQNAINIVEKIDISNRKEYEKIKSMVQGNLKLYLLYIKRLTSKLINLKEGDIEAYINKIFSNLDEFSRISHKPFEKSTILIGEELQTTKILVQEFLKDISTIAENSKPIIQKLDSARNLNNLLRTLKENDALLQSIKLNEKELNDKLKKFNLENDAVKKEILQIKISEKYKKEQEEKQKHKENHDKIENKIQLMKQKINLKQLAKFFHHDKKKKSIIQNYITNFKSSLENDKALDIIPIIKEVQNFDVSDLKLLQSEIFGLSKPFIAKTEEEISFLENDLKKSESEIENIKNHLADELNKKNKFLEKEETIKNKIRELAELNELKIQ